MIIPVTWNPIFRAKFGIPPIRKDALSKILLNHVINLELNKCQRPLINANHPISGILEKEILR
jgi:hypothetical protein